MNRVITIGREFGSGGREFGRRLAEALQVDYYDREIITEISRKTQLAEEYVQFVIERKPHKLYPITIGRTMQPLTMPVSQIDQSIYIEQNRIIKEMADKSPCVIVGRCADEILREYRPVRIFMYADMESRIRRCQSRCGQDEDYSDKEWRQKIMEVDKARSRYYEFYTGKKWGDKKNYDFCINTGNLDMKSFVTWFSKLFEENRDKLVK